MEIFSSGIFWIIIFVIMSIMAFIGYMVENTEFARKALSKELPAPRRKVQEVRQPLADINNETSSGENISNGVVSGNDVNNNISSNGINNVHNNISQSSLSSSFNDLPQIYTEGDIDPLNVNDMMDPWAVGDINGLNLKDKPDMWNVGEIDNLKVREPDYEPNAWEENLPEPDTRMETYYNADNSINNKTDNGSDDLEFFQVGNEPEVLTFGEDDPFENKNS